MRQDEGRLEVIDVVGSSYDFICFDGGGSIQPADTSEDCQQ